MKTTICLMLASVLSGAGSFAQTSSVAGNERSVQVNPGYTITLTQPTSPLNLASKITIPMTIVNVTNGDLLWRAEWSTDKDAWYSGFRFLLTKDGKEVETTFFHRKISGRQLRGDPDEVESGSTVLLPKPPGKMFVITIDLKRLYEITKPGEYTLEVFRFGEDEKTTIHSNIVTLNIVP